MTKNLNVTVTQRPDGIFRAFCPEKPYLEAEGATEAEARQNLVELLERRIEAKAPVAIVETVEDDLEVLPDGE